MSNVRKTLSVSYIRNFIFGVEDGLASTVGFLAGIATAGVPRPTIILTGIVLIFVEAFSMGIGSLLSEHSAQEYTRHREVPFHGSFLGALVMFLSYGLAGFVALAPYILLDIGIALPFSIFLSLIVLFGVGALSARLIKINIFRHSLEMLFIGGIAITAGVIIGTLLQIK